MNKILRYSFVMLLAFICGSVNAGTIVFGDLGLENGVQYSDPFDGGDFTVTFAGGGNDGKYYTTGSGIRVYGGGTMTIAAKSGNLTQIVVTYDGSNKPESNEVVNTGTYDVESGTWTGSANTVVFTRPSGSGHWRVQKIEATIDGAAPTVAVPEFSVAGGLYFEAQSVALTCEEGAKILYTIPAGEDPVYTDDNNYTGVFYDGNPLNITKSTIIKAMAVKDGKTSSIVTAKYTIVNTTGKGTVESPFSVADALLVIDALDNGKTTADEYVIKGNVTEVTEINLEYGNATFNIADATDGDALTVFRAKDANGEKITVEDYVKVGDKVTVQGKLQKYVSGETVTPEVAQNGKILTVETPDPGIDPTATIVEIPVSNYTPWDGTTIEGNVITMGASWKGGAIYIGKDMTQFDYVWIKFKNASGAPNFGVTYDEWTSKADWGPVFAATTTTITDGAGMVGIKLDKKSVMVHGNAETDGVGIGDVYAQHVQQLTIQSASAAASVEVEGIWFGTAEEYAKAGGEVVVRPEAGGSLTMWEGELVYDGWGVSSTVDAKYFEVAQVGDIIYCTVKDVTAEYNPLFKYQDWSDFTDIQATLTKDETHFEGTIATADALDYLQKNGLRFQGLGFTLTKVELKVPGADGINNVTTVKAENAVRYNLAGQKVNNDYKGVVIMNGKKMLNK